CEWTVHHVYECGSKHLSVPVKANRFTNLANLIAISRSYHEREREFVHGDGIGAQWMRWIIAQLYPKAAMTLGAAPVQPAGSPNVGSAKMARLNPSAVGELGAIHEKEPAGTDIATRRLNEVKQGKGFVSVPAKESVRPRIGNPVGKSVPSGAMEPTAIVRELK